MWARSVDLYFHGGTAAAVQRPLRRHLIWLHGWVGGRACGRIIDRWLVLLLVPTNIIMNDKMRIIGQGSSDDGGDTPLHGAEAEAAPQYS